MTPITGPIVSKRLCQQNNEKTTTNIFSPQSPSPETIEDCSQITETQLVPEQTNNFSTQEYCEMLSELASQAAETIPKPIWPNSTNILELVNHVLERADKMNAVENARRPFYEAQLAAMNAGHEQQMASFQVLNETLWMCCNNTVKKTQIKCCVLVSCPCPKQISLSCVPCVVFLGETIFLNFVFFLCGDWWVTEQDIEVWTNSVFFFFFLNLSKKKMWGVLLRASEWKKEKANELQKRKNRWNETKFCLRQLNQSFFWLFLWSRNFLTNYIESWARFHKFSATRFVLKLFVAKFKRELSCCFVCFVCSQKMWEYFCVKTKAMFFSHFHKKNTLCSFSLMIGWYLSSLSFVLFGGKLLGAEYSHKLPEKQKKNELCRDHFSLLTQKIWRMLSEHSCG